MQEQNRNSFSSSSSPHYSFGGLFFKSSPKKSAIITTPRMSNNVSNSDSAGSGSDLEKNDYFDLPFSSSHCKKYIDIITSEYDTGKFKDCIKIAGGIFYVDKKTGYEIFAIANKNETTAPLNFYFLNKADLIGEGAQSLVYAAYDLKTNKKVAAKLSNSNSILCLADFRQEAKNLQKLNRLKGQCSFSVSGSQDEKICKTKKKLILMDYYTGVDLPQFLYKIDPSYDKESEHYFSEKINLPMLMKLKMIKSVLQELSKIHSANLLHRDIKSENIRVNDANHNKFDINMIDVGASIEATVKNNEYVGTPGYIAPEMCLDSHHRAFYSHQADFFSVGIVGAEILTRHPFQSDYRKKRKEVKLSNFSNEVSLADVYNLMPDVFSSQNKDDNKIDMNMTETEINLFIFKQLQILIASLTHENPEKRLEKSSLQDEIAKLNDLIEYATQWELAAKKKQTIEELKQELVQTEQDIQPLQNKLKMPSKTVHKDNIVTSFLRTFR